MCLVFLGQMRDTDIESFFFFSLTLKFFYFLPFLLFFLWVWLLPSNEPSRLRYRVVESTHSDLESFLFTFSFWYSKLW